MSRPLGTGNVVSAIGHLNHLHGMVGVAPAVAATLSAVGESAGVGCRVDAPCGIGVRLDPDGRLIDAYNVLRVLSIGPARVSRQVATDHGLRPSLGP